jgi:hypothetical protein
VVQLRSISGPEPVVKWTGPDLVLRGTAPRGWVTNLVGHVPYQKFVTRPNLVFLLRRLTGSPKSEVQCSKSKPTAACPESGFDLGPWTRSRRQRAPRSAAQHVANSIQPQNRLLCEISFRRIWNFELRHKSDFEPYQLASENRPECSTLSDCRALKITEAPDRGERISFLDKRRELPTGATSVTPLGLKETKGFPREAA